MQGFNKPQRNTRSVWCWTLNGLLLAGAVALLGVGVSGAALAEVRADDADRPAFAPGGAPTQLGGSPAFSSRRGADEAPVHAAPGQSGEHKPISAMDADALFDNGQADGANALGNFMGEWDGEFLDWQLIDDFALEAAAEITAVEIRGVWLEGGGAETPVEGLRVRFWEADEDGLPGQLLFDEFMPPEAYETGEFYFERPEVVYMAHIPPIELEPAGHVVSVQPVGAIEPFYQLTSASGLDEIFGIEIHVSYPDGGFEPWTPGHIVFDEYHDVVFTVWGEFIDPGPDPFPCEGYCGGPSPFGCWCDEWCWDFDDCCDDVCEACEDELDFCDDLLDPYVCEGYCEEMAPGGCWCDEWCKAFGDCCDNVCEACEDELDFCDDLLDPYVCEGFCGEMAPGGCWCDEWCDSFGDCCEGVCDACEDELDFCDDLFDPYACTGDLNDDGNVNVLDLLHLLESWGPCDDPEDCPSDLNKDAVVNVLDLLLLLENWGPCPQPEFILVPFPILTVEGECADGILDVYVEHVTPGGEIALYHGDELRVGNVPPGEPCERRLLDIHNPQILDTVVADDDGVAHFEIVFDDPEWCEQLLIQAVDQDDLCELTNWRRTLPAEGKCIYEFDCFLVDEDGEMITTPTGNPCTEAIWDLVKQLKEELDDADDDDDLLQLQTTWTTSSCTSDDDCDPERDVRAGIRYQPLDQGGNPSGRPRGCYAYMRVKLVGCGEQGDEVSNTAINTWISSGPAPSGSDCEEE